MDVADSINKMLIAEEVESPVNGMLRVTKDPVWGTLIASQTTVGWLTQSGGVARSIWKSTLNKLKKSGHKVDRCLILGLGGGSIALLARKRWPGARITGVDLDEVIIELGKKYLRLGEQGVEIVIGDADKFINKQKEKYDLICIDTYCGDEFPEKLTSVNFLKAIQKNLEPQGVAVFNRLYYGEKRAEARRFGERLESVFAKVEIVYPEANVMYICSGKFA